MTPKKKSRLPLIIVALLVLGLGLGGGIFAGRIVQEDILSIVDTSFMPYGMECDQYQIIGTILFYTKVFNSYTREAMYQMTIECNGMTFDICINKKDLMGDPEVGRRFKGQVWLQGNVKFKN